MSSFDKLMSAREQCAFNNIFGYESRPAPGLKSAATAVRYGPCESTATGTIQGLGFGAAGSFKLSTGEVVLFVLFNASRIMRRNSWHAVSERSHGAGRGGWGKSEQAALDDLKQLMEDGYI